MVSKSSNHNGNINAGATSVFWFLGATFSILLLDLLFEPNSSWSGRLLFVGLLSLFRSWLSSAFLTWIDREGLTSSQLHPVRYVATFFICGALDGAICGGIVVYVLTSVNSHAIVYAAIAVSLILVPLLVWGFRKQILRFITASK